MSRSFYGRSKSKNTTKGAACLNVPWIATTPAPTYTGSSVLLSIVAAIGLSVSSGTYTVAPTYNGQAATISLNSLVTSVSNGTHTTAPTYTGAATSFSLNTLVVSSTGGTWSVPAAFTHYVSPSGTATTWAEAQNISTPANFSFAMDNAVAGNTVAFRGNAGTYTINRSGGSWDTPIMRPANNGSLGNYIQFVNYTGETPHVVGSSVTTAELDATAFGCSTGDQYIIWDGFSGALSESAVFDGSGGYNTNMLFIMFDCQYCIARNFTMTGVYNGNASSGGNSSPMTLEQSNNCEISNCTISGNTGFEPVNVTGIWLLGNQNCTVKSNLIYSCSNGISQKTGPNQGVIIEYNYLHTIDIYGIRVSEESSTNTACYVRNNLIRTCNTGIFLEGSTATFVLNNWETYYNTIVNCSIGLFASSNINTATYHSNLYYGCNTDVIGYFTAYPASVHNYNCFYPTTLISLNWSAEYTSVASWQAASIYDDNSIETNPTFVNAAGTTPADFALQGGSPCIGTGLAGANIGVQNLALVGIQ